MTNKATNRFTLVLIALAFLAPMSVAWVAYINMDSPGKTRNLGDLVQPIRPLADFDLPLVGGSRLTREKLTGKWTLVYIGGADCGENCAHALYKIRQSRMAQNENVRRIQRLLIVTAEQPGPGYAKVLGAHKGMMVALDGASAPSLLEQFQLKKGEDVVAAGRVYIVDPLGNLMMSYEPGFDPRHLVKDLQFLLRASRIG